MKLEKNKKFFNESNVQKIKNILLLVCSILVLFSPLLGAEISFYISSFFILSGGMYIMTKKNLTLKKDRTILLVLLSILIASIMAFTLKSF